MDEELQDRILRMYAAIGDTAEVDISKFRPHLGRSEKCVFVCQDFRGSLSDEQISNLAHSAISNLANLRGHLRRWARLHGHDPNKINEAVKKSIELQVIIDLSNVDKHGYPPRDGGCSKRSPKLTEVNRVMELSIGCQPDSSSVSFALTPKPVVQVVGSGAATVVVSGRIVDKAGSYLGDLHAFLTKGTAAWEHLVAQLGVKKER
jgi:hypothetical protein